MTPPTKTLRGRRARRRPDERRGAATVEFALASFIVFTLFMGMIEVARFHIVRHSLDQAVYMGARAGIVPGATTAEVEQIVQDRLNAAGVVSGMITVSPGTIDSTTTEVTVSVSAPYDQNSWLTPKYFTSMTIDASLTLDHENVAFN